MDEMINRLSNHSDRLGSVATVEELIAHEEACLQKWMRLSEKAREQGNQPLAESIAIKAAASQSLLEGLKNRHRHKQVSIEALNQAIELLNLYDKEIFQFVLKVRERAIRVIGIKIKLYHILQDRKQTTNWHEMKEQLLTGEDLKTLVISFSKIVPADQQVKESVLKIDELVHQLKRYELSVEAAQAHIEENKKQAKEHVAPLIQNAQLAFNEYRKLKQAGLWEVKKSRVKKMNLTEDLNDSKLKRSLEERDRREAEIKELLQFVEELNLSEQ